MDNYTLTVEEAAAQLHKSEYREEGSRELFAKMKANRLVAVFGYSDDLAELRGAIDDEVGGSKFYLDRGGIMQSRCEEGDRCPYFAESLRHANWIDPKWASEGYSWTYEASFPFVTFDVMEDGDPYCRGIVFSLDSLS